jgi:hypothetical protein
LKPWLVINTPLCSTIIITKKLNKGISVASKNGAGTADLSAKLNRLEDQVVNLTAEIKTNKQEISELKRIISHRDSQIQALELKLGYAQKSLLEQAIDKIQDCREQLRTGMDEKIINPTVAQIQQQIKTAQEFVGEAKEILIEKKTWVDKSILTAKETVVEYPELVKIYVEKSIILPALALFNQTLDTVSNQAITSRNVVEDRAIYPSKVLLEEILNKLQDLPDLVNAQIIAPLLEANKKASSVANDIYPNTLDYINKKLMLISDIVNQALFEIADQVKKSPFWDGKNKINPAY